MKHLLLSLLLLIPFGFGFASEGGEETASVQLKGIVVDSNTGEPIPGAEIKIEAMDLKIYTDFDGTFEIQNLKASTSYNVEVAFVSYQEAQIKDLQLPEGYSDSLIIKLNP